MKKLLILFGLAGILFAARYPMVAEYNYLKGCIGTHEKMESYCICTLNAIENRYSLGEFITALQDKKESKKLINYAVDKCLDKLKK